MNPGNDVMMLTLEEARRRINEAVPVLPPVTRSFQEAVGWVLAEDIVAESDLPPWPNSSMDGYAVRGADLSSASEERPVRLRVVGELPAGRAPDRAVEYGEAIRIMTGAPVPDGADAVVIVEKTRSDGDWVDVMSGVKPGENIRQAGENVARNERVLEKGTLLRAPEIGLLASLGRTRVSVHQKPSVAVISSGDELVPPDESPGPGQIRDSNRFTLTAHLSRLGFQAVDCGNARDREEEIENLFRGAASWSDAIVSTGGVSVGDFDLTKKVLARLGRVDFWKIAIRPGKPVAFGFIEGKPVFGLPGNPVSSLVVLDQIVRPALRKMAGHAKLYRDTYRALLLEPLTRHPGRTEFIRAVIRYQDGRFLARTTGPQGSGILKSVSRANGLIIVPAGVESLDAGAEVDCQLFSEEI
jgi:molybdopterin molybdotransferase